MRIIRGKYGRRRFDVPKNISARPTTDFARENVFNVLENIVDFDGSRALDLFAGTGAISFEFLSRGCDSVTSVEKAATQANFIRDVAGRLRADGLKLIRGDVFRFVPSCAPASFDIVFADPPYDLDRFDEVAPLVLDSGIVAPGGIFILEHGRDRDYSGHPAFSRHLTYGSVNFTIFTTDGND